MKKVLLIVGLTLLLTLICTIMLYSQVSNWRTNPPQQSQPQQRVETPKVQPPTPPRNDVSNWRNQPPSNGYDRPLRTRPGSNIIVRDPFFNDWGWGWNRWNMWGAPTFGWNYWNPGFYFNDWGYRQPARVYVYDNGKRDTIKGKKPIINFGIQKTTDNQVGGFFTIGNKGYFVVEYNASVERDNSTFFPFGNVTQVDFPLVNDLVQRQSFYVGVGKRIKRTGIHMMIGTVSEDVKWRGRDDLGYITFPKYLDRFTTIKIGTLHDYKNFTLKVDYDPIIRNGTFGLGINF
jgi:hypothetical protein